MAWSDFLKRVWENNEEGDVNLILLSPGTACWKRSGTETRSRYHLGKCCSGHRRRPLIRYDKSRNGVNVTFPLCRQQDLFRVLKAYTLYRPEEGYCQAQAPVAAVLLMNMPAEVGYNSVLQLCGNLPDF